MNNTTVTWECRYFFEILILFLSIIYLEVGLMDHMVTLFLIFWGTPIVFSIMAAPVYIPTNSVQEFLLFHVLTNICYLVFWFLVFFFFDYSHSQGCRMISHLWFWFSCPWWLVILSTFSCTCCPFVYFLWKTVYSGTLPIFKLNYLFSIMVLGKMNIHMQKKKWNWTPILHHTQKFIWNGLKN